MTTSIDRESAKIYQFPARGRFAVNGNNAGAKELALGSSWMAKTTACGSSWYHDEAIREEEERERTH